MASGHKVSLSARKWPQGALHTFRTLPTVQLQRSQINQ